MIIVPTSCKNGIVLLQGGSLGAREWAMQLAIENEDYKHFDMTADGNGLIWKQLLTSFCGGEATIRGMRDLGDGQDIITDLGGFLDDTGIAYLGYDLLHGFNIIYTVVDHNGGSNTDTPTGNTVEIKIKITACEWTSVGPD